MEITNHIEYTGCTNEEIEIFRDMIRRFLEQEVAPHYEQWETDHLIPRKFWYTMARAGLLLVDMPEKFGGAGSNQAITLLIPEESRLRMD